MTSNNPEEIRRDIERTRQELSEDVDALADKVSPTRIAQRRVHSAKGTVASVKDTIMGTASRTTDAAGSGLSTAADKVSGAGSAVTEAASTAPQTARRHAEGNPLAAGLIAFGVGWLASSLLPPTDQEQRAATAVKDKASGHADKVTGSLVAVAQEMRENVSEPAQRAAESIRSTAAEAASTVHADAQSAADDVMGQAQAAKDVVAGSAASGSSNSSGGDSIDLEAAQPAGTTYGGQSFDNR